MLEHNWMLHVVTEWMMPARAHIRSPTFTKALKTVEGTHGYDPLLASEDYAMYS